MILGKWPTWRTILYHVFIFIFNSLHVSSTSCSSSGGTDCVNTASGNCHSVYCRWPCRVQFGSELPTCTCHGHRHRVTVTRGCIDTICLSWWWTRCARNTYRVKNKNKYIVKNCASRWSFTKNHNRMHGQQNVKYNLYYMKCIVYIYIYNRNKIRITYNQLQRGSSWLVLWPSTLWHHALLSNYENNFDLDSDGARGSQTVRYDQQQMPCT
jgi:hypothetical protein